MQKLQRHEVYYLCNLEDTPIDDYIYEFIPDNVVRIVAVNAVTFGGKVIPAPYGVQRDEVQMMIELMILNHFMNERDPEHHLDCSMLA